MRITPLDRWARKEIGCYSMEEWQLEKLRQTLLHAKNSVFYRQRLPETLPESLKDLRKIPLMDAGDIVQEGSKLLCVPPGEIARIVTLLTSGTTGAPKRLYFTAADLERTVDFFGCGLTTVVEPGGVVAVMMPCNAPLGVGDLICRGLERIPARAVRWGPLASLSQTAAMLREENVTAIVGFPAQVLALTRYLAIAGAQTNLQSVLLSADNIPFVAVREMESRGLRVYRHFGMSETGYGCAIDCDAHVGQHIRELDVLVEILDPETWEPLPDQEWGEIVITTLTRQGMPLIRYRTGDRSRVLPGICACGSTLRRLDHVQGRWREGALLSGGVLTMRDMDESLFALPQVMDYSAKMEHGILLLRLNTFADVPCLTPCEVYKAAATIPVLADMEISVEIERMHEYSALYQTKRFLTWNEKGNGQKVI